MILCERCNCTVHKDCAIDNQEATIHEGPWISNECRTQMLQTGCEDIMWDFGVIEYLFLGTLPESPEERDRILNTAKNYRAHGNDLQRRLP